VNEFLPILMLRSVRGVGHGVKFGSAEELLDGVLLLWG